jgi:hypothetical protein
MALEYMEALVRNLFRKVTLHLIGNKPMASLGLMRGELRYWQFSDGAMQPPTLPVGNDKGSG